MNYSGIANLQGVVGLAVGRTRMDWGIVGWALGKGIDPVEWGTY